MGTRASFHALELFFPGQASGFAYTPLADELHADFAQPAHFSGVAQRLYMHDFLAMSACEGVGFLGSIRP